MKVRFFFLLLLFSSAYASEPRDFFPHSPDPSLTPGSLCQAPDEYRYTEQIAYCIRNVSTKMKRDIIAEYDSERGYHILEMNRREFKIDHFIPLCIGGSNKASNLWPQHKSVFVKTDPVEQKICRKIREGKLMQAQAVELIREAKTDFTQIDRITQYLDRL